MAIDRAIIRTADGERLMHLNGWKRDAPDDRDQKFRVSYPLSNPTTLPAKFDTTHNGPAIEQQGELGACTGAAYVGAVEKNAYKAGHGQEISVLAHYYNTRRIEHTEAIDCGASVRSAIKAGSRYGLILDADWPYDIEKFNVAPPDPFMESASKNLVQDYQRIVDGDLETLKYAIYEDLWIPMGFSVFSNFTSETMSEYGMLGLPSKDDRHEGGHCVLACGWDDNILMPDGTLGALLCRNSWGDAWGLPPIEVLANRRGYFFMSYENYRRYASDAWAVRSTVLM